MSKLSKDFWVMPVNAVITMGDGRDDDDDDSKSIDDRLPSRMQDVVHGYGGGDTNAESKGILDIVREQDREWLLR